MKAHILTGRISKYSYSGFPNSYFYAPSNYRLVGYAPSCRDAGGYSFAEVGGEREVMI